jgi:hypothetical protein
MFSTSSSAPRREQSFKQQLCASGSPVLSVETMREEFEELEKPFTRKKPSSIRSLLRHGSAA